MSNLIEQILRMEEGHDWDAIILQDKQPGSNGAPNYYSASAVIRRIRTHAGTQWAFHTLMMGRTGSGHYGTIDDVVKAAESQFGVKSDVREWIGVEYCDPEFPANLIPM